MKARVRRILICLTMLTCLLFAANGARAQTATGAVRGQVMDPSGAAISDATVLVVPPQGAAFTATTNREGSFEIKDISPGTYKVQVMAQGFATFEKDGVVVAAGHTVKLEVSLSIKQQEERIVVTDEATRVELSPENNASQLVLKGKDLEALSDDPDQLQSDLQALAGPAAGPNGGQIYIDGFTGGQLPPKSSIREIRVNQNPFSSEYDRLGYGRIEIFTKPGTDKLHGEFMVDGNTSAFNSRSPFAGSAAQPSYHSEFLHANLGGPLDKHASYFVSVFHRGIDDLSIINAETLDSNFQPVLLTQTVPNPRSRTNLSPRLDFQLGENNTLTVRYQYYRDSETNNGIGEFNLASQGTNSTGTEHDVQVSDTQVLSPRTINETRFRFERESNEDTPQSTLPTINVNGAFTGGGSNGGSNVDVRDAYEMQNYTSISLGKHYVKFGARVRVTKDTNAAMSGFNGAFTFDSLAAYQITQQGLQNGLTPAQIRAAGGGASKFTIVQGNAAAENTYADLGIFAQDEWRALPSVTLSLGLRMESQNQINDHADFAPRFALAWGLGGGKRHQAQTVLRAGWGIFYDRFDQGLLLQAQRLNGVTQQQFIANNPDFYPNLPTPTQLSGAATSPTIYQVDPRLTAPYTMQTGVSLERQLTRVANIAITYLNSRGEHALLTRNINAPLPPDYNPANRPLGSTENIYQFESAGVFKQNQLIVNGSVRMGAALSLFGYYSLNYADSDTDSANSFPSNSYNIQQDYGRAAFDVRHRVFFGGTVGMPYGFRLSPFLVAMSGAPFNITLGQDLNNDSIFNDRPTFATLQTDPTKIKVTPWGTFDLAPLPGEPVIPVNLGTSRARFSLNMRLAKTFGFGAKKESAAGGPGGPNIGSFGRPMRGGHHGFWGMGSNEQKFNLTVGLFVRNIFNNVNVNPPIGVLTSPLFGESNSLATGPFSSGAANRRIDLQMSFSF